MDSSEDDEWQKAVWTPPRSFPLVKTDSPAPLSVDCLNSFYETNKNYLNVLVLFLQEHFKFTPSFAVICPKKTQHFSQPLQTCHKAAVQPVQSFLPPPATSFLSNIKTKNVLVPIKKKHFMFLGVGTGKPTQTACTFSPHILLFLFPFLQQLKNQSFSRIEQSPQVQIVNC